MKYMQNDSQENKRTNKWNETNDVLGLLCAHIGQTGSEEHLKNGEKNEMTLSSRHRIRNSNPGSLMPTVDPHNIESLRVSREDIIFFET